MKKKIIVWLACIAVLFSFAGCSGMDVSVSFDASGLNINISGDASGEAAVSEVDYSIAENWAYFGEGEDKPADLFLICPTVDTNDEFSMSMDDEETKAKFVGALNMERGIYEAETRMYAPYYRQAAMKVYSMTPEEREPYLEYAYEDISESFKYYLENENSGRPIVLAGFSQGADMCYRLLEEYFGDEELYDRLVAVYAIGWPCTEEMTREFPQIKPAVSEDDTGVVVSIDCEAPEVDETFITPAGTKAVTINPLNWKTDGTPADRTENLGACFTDYSGNIKNEVGELCGCYIDENRGVIKVPDVDAADYPPIVPGLPEGSYHIYDYQFFYRNLEKNVHDRVESFLKTDAEVKQEDEGEEYSVTYQELIDANSNEAVFSRHKNWSSKVEAAQDDTAVRAFGLYGFESFARPGMLYAEKDYYEEHTEDHHYYVNALYTRTDDYFMRKIEGEGEGYSFNWYVMTDEEKSDTRLKIGCDPDAIPILSDGAEVGEHIVSTESNRDGTLTVTTNAPADIFPDFAEFPDAWKGATIDFRYIVDEATLEMEELNVRVITDEGEFPFMTQINTFDVEEPEGLAKLEGFAEYRAMQSFDEPQKITVVYDPDTEKEESFEMSKSKMDAVSIYTREGYDLFYDKEGTDPYAGTKGMDKITVYALPVE